MANSNPEHLEPFPPTRWTQVSLSAAADPEARCKALAVVLGNYYPALHSHLTVVRHVPSAQADDLLQGFIASQVLAHDLFARADPARGRFRTFVVTALDRYVSSQWRAEHTQRRGGGQVASIEEADGPAGAPVSSCAVFDLAWARQVLTEATRRMRERCRSTGREEVWGVFESRLLRPILEDAEPLPYGELVRRFGLSSPRRARDLLAAARRICRRCLTSVVAEYAAGEDGTSTEVEDLCSIFAQAGSAGALAPVPAGAGASGGRRSADAGRGAAYEADAVETP